MAFSEGLSDTGEVTGRGRPYLRGSIIGAGTFLGGVLHTLPFSSQISMAKIAFLGIGQMGTPMAARLLEAGHELTVWNRTRAKADSLVERGATAAVSPADAVSGAEFVVTMLANPAALEQVLFADDGVVRALSPGQSLIEMSTVGPDTIRSVGRRLPDQVTLVDAPVRGSVPEANTGRLAIFVGATLAAFKHVEPLLSPLGTPTTSAGWARAQLPSWSPT